MSRRPTKNIDYTSRDYEAYRELLIQELQKKMPEYTDISQTDAGIVILEALANGLDILSLYSDVIANDVVLPTTQDRKLAVIIAECLGYIPYNQTASIYPQVFVLDEPLEEDLVISRGTVVKTKESSDLATLYFETMDDLTIPAGKLGDEKDENNNYIYTTRVQHGTTITQDVIGSSTGASLQSFKLSYTEVLIDSIKLLINEGEGQREWTRVNSFIDSDGSSMAYIASVDDFDVCTIEFGNGLRGKIPNVYPNGITATYRVGGGDVGNVSANIITELETNIPYIGSTFNLEAIVKGHDKEGLESIKENAPASFRARNRLVTLDDYSDLLRINFYDFLRLITVRDSSDKKRANIYYMMRSGYEMTDSLVESIADFISERSMVGTTYSINPYTPQPIDLECVLYVDRDYDFVELQANVEKYIREVTFAYGELQFEDYIVKSDLETEIKNTFSGILSFRINSPTEDIIKPSESQNVLTLGSITIHTETL